MTSLANFALGTAVRQGDRSAPSNGSPDSSSRTGIVFLIASNGLTALIDAFAKYLSVDLHVLQIVWSYCAFIGLLLTLYVLWQPIPFRRAIYTEHLALHLGRAAMLVMTISLLFLGFKYMPIADATAIAFMSPLFVTVLSVFLLGEKVNAHRVAAVVLGLVGVIIIIRPGASVFHWAVFMPLISAAFFALFQIFTRQLATRDSRTTTLFYTGIGGFLWSSLAVVFVWQTPTIREWLIFFGLGILGVGAHLCMIRAFSAAPASLLAPFNYVKLVWIAILGYLMFDEVPGLMVWVGGGVIVLSGLYAYYDQQREH